MTNNQVVESFFSHKSGKSLNMSTDGERLYSYQTCMAEWHDGVVYVNGTKYSRTTSKQMCHFWYILNREIYHYFIVRGIPDFYGATSSVYSWYIQHDEKLCRQRKSKAKFNTFIDDIDNFLGHNDSRTLSVASWEKIHRLMDSAKPHNYHAQKLKFTLIKQNIDKSMCYDFKRRMGERHLKDKEARMFSFN